MWARINITYCTSRLDSSTWAADCNSSWVTNEKILPQLKGGWEGIVTCFAGLNIDNWWWNDDSRLEQTPLTFRQLSGVTCSTGSTLICHTCYKESMSCVGILYCKRPIRCLATSKILTHHLHRPDECVPPAFSAGGGHTRWVERGLGGQYFGRRQTQLCTLHM